MEVKVVIAKDTKHRCPRNFLINLLVDIYNTDIDLSRHIEKGYCSEFLDASVFPNHAGPPVGTARSAMASSRQLWKPQARHI